MSWTPEKIEIVRTHWIAGYSAGQIANVLGMTRNAVIGKITRLKLPRRADNGITAAAATRLDHKTGRRRAFSFLPPKQKRQPSSPPEIADYSRETVVTPEHQRILFEDLVDGRCKYAHGDHPPYSFCGAKSVAPGASWCPTHFHVVTGAPHPSQVFREASKNPEPENMGFSHVLEAVP